MHLPDERLQPDEGRVSFDGQGAGTFTVSDLCFMAITDIREFTPDSWRNHIGLVPQDPILFTGTITENIAYGMPNATRAEIEDAARAANCDFIWEMPYGFDTQSTLLILSAQQVMLIEMDSRS